MAAEPSNVKDRFAGLWRLNSPIADGMLYYDRGGHMTVQSAPKKERPRAGATPTAEEALAALDGYVAYFGTYTVDAAAGTVTHHQAGTVQPGRAVDLIRSFEFESDNRLILRPVGGGKDIIWERIG